MSKYIVWQYPDTPEVIEKILLNDERKIVVIGVIGKSAFPDCNKMACMDVLDRHPKLIDHKPAEGQIQFYYKPFESILWVHFVTTYDAHCMQEILLQELLEPTDFKFLTFQYKMKSRFARTFLFATQICHIIVFVETSSTFDTSLVSIFKSLRTIREDHVLKFLPRMIKNSNGAVNLLSKKSRLCSPRMIFCFENLSKGYEKSAESIAKLEYDLEDSIYKIMRNEHIIYNYNHSSLFLLPANQRFVYYNVNDKLRKDPLENSVQLFYDLLEKPNSFLQSDKELQDLLPFEDFGRPINFDQQKSIITAQKTSNEIKDPLKNRKFMDILQPHIDEALKSGYNDTTKYKKNNFVITNASEWFEIFEFFHKIFILNPDDKDFQTHNVEYKAYLDNFDGMVNFDAKFFQACCDQGLEKAYAMYINPKWNYYSAEVHRNMVEEAVTMYRRYARGPQKFINEQSLREMCESCWKNGGKQQCEYPSLRGRPCIRPKHFPQDVNEHSSGVVYFSACNCGHTQGRRDDPYSVRHANYEFYVYMSNNCNLCAKVKRIHFPVFQPSINDYRAAEFNRKYGKNIQSKDNRGQRQSNNHGEMDNEKVDDHHDLNTMDGVADDVDDDIHSGNRLAISQDSHTNLSLSTESMDNDLSKLKGQEQAEPAAEEQTNLSSTESLNELILEVKNSKCLNDTEVVADADGNGDGDSQTNNKNKTAKGNDDNPAHGKDDINETKQTIEKHSVPIQHQPSTTEYLAGMVHTESPAGLLPQFPSWSLCCVGASSMYSHVNGLMEHFQCGFLAGTNFLLPWDVHIRFKHMNSWLTYKKGRGRKISEGFAIKIFVGFEYECPNGHRFMMTAPDNILSGKSGGTQRNSASKVVYNNMPLYYPCPCSPPKKQLIAQLMRIHVVTPKAPVYIMLDPKVQIGDYIFKLGLPKPPKLSQSAYWILRLPYIYQGDEEPIPPPKEVSTNALQQHGYLRAGMFGVSEVEYDD